MSKVCYIYGAGEHFSPPPIPDETDLVIAADGGYTFLQKHNILPNIVVGDFDSLSSPPEHENVVTLPAEKDDTDMSFAVNLGFEKGYRIFKLYGGTGGRIDHTIANIQLLSHLAQNGAQGNLYGGDCVITAIKNTSISFPETASGYISIFAHTEKAIGVTETGLKYSLTDATLLSTNPLGVSNEFIGEESQITVSTGIILVVYPIDVQPY